MRWTKRTAAAVAVAAGLAVAASGAAAEPRVVLGPASTLELRGTSTLHDYESRATRLELAVVVASEHLGEGSPLASLATPGTVKSLVLMVPVAAMRSNRDGLDKNMYKALKSEGHPNITFRLTELVRATPTADGALDVTAKGELELAGQKRVIDLALRATPTPQGVVLEGSKTLLMSDYGIKPPTMMLGTLKTKDRVDIAFRLVVVPEGF